MHRWAAHDHVAADDQAAAVEALRRCGARQAGRFTSAQAQRLGCRPMTLRRLRAVGEIEPVRKGVWCFVAAPADGLALDWETVLAAGAGAGLLVTLEEDDADALAEPEHRDGLAVLSGATALDRMGVTRAAAHDRTDVLLQGRGRPRVPWARVHRTRHLSGSDVTVRFGPPMTTATRALVELTTVLPWADVVALLDDVVCARLASRSWANRRAWALRPGRPRVQWLIDVTEPDAEPDFRSWLERTFGDLVVDAGLPRPQWNVAVSDERGRIGVVDCRWSRSGFARDLVVELEGLRFHTAPAQRRADAARFNRLTRRHAVLRFTWEDVVRRPEETVAQVADRLRLP
ncbi:MAG: hypothetical protein BRC31_05340 [Actinobacteria bacterium QS_5_72_10]|nr:MAG: hypothetical protein BRC31_05340 [Actinobacteria bacterium QS_5_72_10]